MSRILDKFTYTTSYKQDFCIGQKQQPREEGHFEDVLIDCSKPVYVKPVSEDFKVQGENNEISCPCRPGGFMPQRGAVASGLPTYLNERCTCYQCRDCQAQTRKPTRTHDRLILSNETEKPAECPSRSPSPARAENTMAIVSKKEIKQTRVSDCFESSFVPLRPLPRGKTEHQRAGRNSGPPWPQERRNLRDCPVIQQPSDQRIPGPFWNRQRPDERREVDVARKKKIEQKSSEIRGVQGRSSDVPRACRPISSEPGPSWMRDQADGRRGREGSLRGGPMDHFRGQERPDERREPEIDRKKKFGKQRIEAAEVIHGEDMRYPGARSGPDDGAVDDQAQPYTVNRPCYCTPQQTRGNMESWAQSNNPPIPEDVEKIIRQVPEARLSCAPAAEPSKFDQPNTFMKKLYEKYPYLYQVLKETPPEELVSKVFKDRFLSTYQVDYLHMGVGKEKFSGGGAEREEVYTGTDGEPESKTIPGCSYRYSTKGDFGRKKTVYDKKEVEEEIVEVEKEEPRVSEYMATISKLGGEIISDQLYKVVEIAKTMKYPNSHS